MKLFGLFCNSKISVDLDDPKVSYGCSLQQMSDVSGVEIPAGINAYFSKSGATCFMSTGNRKIGEVELLSGEKFILEKRKLRKVQRCNSR